MVSSFLFFFFLLQRLGLGADSNYYVEMELAGEGIPAAPHNAFTLEVRPEWAPRGAARFKELVEQKFYDDNRFFRVLDGKYDIWIAQFGINGDPDIQSLWTDRRISDDPPKVANNRGTLAFATSGPNTRTTQLFLNYQDSGTVLDRDFAPFARVVSGMEVVDAINKVHEEAPNQSLVHREGNEYLDREYPGLTHLVSARVVEAPPGFDKEGGSKGHEREL